MALNISSLHLSVSSLFSFPVSSSFICMSFKSLVYLHIQGLLHSSNPNAPMSIPSSSKPSACPRNRVFHTLSLASSSSANLCTMIFSSDKTRSLAATSPSCRCLWAILKLSSHPLQASQNSLSCRLMPSKPMLPPTSVTSAPCVLGRLVKVSSTSEDSGLSTQTRLALGSSPPPLVVPRLFVPPEPSAFSPLSIAWAGTCQN